MKYLLIQDDFLIILKADFPLATVFSEVFFPRFYDYTSLGNDNDLNFCEESLIVLEFILA